jgi:hypothetical protein
MSDELNIVKLAAALEGTLSPEYTEALSRAFETFCVLSDRVEKRYRAAHPDYDEAKRSGDMEKVESLAHEETLWSLKLEAFAALLATVGTKNPNDRLRRPPGPQDTRARRQ